MDSFTSSVDSSAVLALMDRVGASMEFHARDVARLTAKIITDEAQTRVRRATGQTEEGIHWDLSYDGKAYVVMAYQAGAQDPVDLYLEKGTKFMYKRPFFLALVGLENDAYLRRMQDRMQEVVDDLGR